MANLLSSLEVHEVSLVDRPANAEYGIPRARVALFKRDSWDPSDPICKAVDGLVDKDGKLYDGVAYPKSDFAFTPDEVPAHWKLRLTASPGGKPDAAIVGAAVAALGDGFRGKKVLIPAEALPGVKARVLSAWKEANPDKGSDELPEVLKHSNKEKPTMTLQELETAVVKQGETLASLTAERDILKAENAMVLKMSAADRKAYAGMSEEKRKEFMAADEAGKKTMLTAAAGEEKEKAMRDCMSPATKAEFDAAGPIKKAAMLEAQEAIVNKAKTKAADDAEEADEPVDDEAEEDLEVETEKTKSLTLKLASTEDQVTKLAHTVTEITKRERLSSFAKRAEQELPNTAGTPEEKGDMLMKMADAFGENSESFNKFLGQLKAADKALSLHFGEVGKAGGPVPAEAALNAKAAEISKRDNIDTSHAMAKVMQENPELYLDYERQHRRASQQQ